MKTGLFRVTVSRADTAPGGEHAAEVRAGNWIAALAQAAQLPAGFAWRERGEKMPENKTLDLKVTVTCAPSGPDAILAKMDKTAVRLTSSPYTLKVISVERADGQPFGLEAAFEEYWNGNVGSKPGDEASDEKLYARQAFLYAAEKYGKSTSGNS